MVAGLRAAAGDRGRHRFPDAALWLDARSRAGALAVERRAEAGVRGRPIPGRNANHYPHLFPAMPPSTCWSSNGEPARATLSPGGEQTQLRIAWTSRSCRHGAAAAPETRSWQALQAAGRARPQGRRHHGGEIQAPGHAGSTAASASSRSPTTASTSRSSGCLEAASPARVGASRRRSRGPPAHS